MGLDITAYSKIQKVNVNFNEYDEPVDSQTGLLLHDVVRLRVNSEFPERAPEIEDEKTYSYVDTMDFRAGSSSYYIEWRDDLAQLAGWPLGRYNQFGETWESYAASAWESDGGPFWELIFFSHCEGVLGPSVCVKLAKDFALYQKRAKSYEDKLFRIKYAEWKKAFDLAADDGVVVFS